MIKEQQEICKYISMYLYSGIDLDTSLELVIKRIRHKKLRKIWQNIRIDIQSGKTLRDSCIPLRDLKLFDSVEWSIFASAEFSGNLAETFTTIGRNIKDRLKLAASLFGILLYPVGMILASGGMIFFLLTVVFPKITPMFSSMNIQLPVTARVLLFSSNFLLKNMWQILTILSLIIISCVILYNRKENFRYAVHRAILSVPIYGRLIKYKIYDQISSAVYILMNNRKTLIESITTMRGTIKSLPFKVELADIVTNLEMGQSVPGLFQKSLLFDSEWFDLLTVGERTATLPKAFGDLALYYKEKNKEMIELIMRVSEPLALGASAFVVLIIALAVIGPMYSLIEHINTR